MLAFNTIFHYNHRIWRQNLVMRLRHKKNAENLIQDSPMIINNQDIKSIFVNDSPLHLELGMGKGRFITKMALKFPNINFIGIEKSATIVLKAVDLFNKLHADYEFNNELGESQSIENLKFMCKDIANLKDTFLPHSIDKIYLNFSDPWPKKRHESRRLTHHNFLSLYEYLLKKDSFLEFKTDNLLLFEFSLEEIKNSNFKLLEFTYDLHNDNKLNEGNIMTEYEEKFSKIGNKICKLIAQI